MSLRDHQPIVLDQFNGLWNRGDITNTPQDHFTDCNNIIYTDTKNFGTRYGLGISQTVTVPLTDVKRIYNYPTPTGNTLIVLTYDGTTGKIYHVVDPATVYGPLLTIVGMVDFAFQPYAGRGYISPIGYYTQGDLNIETGLAGEFLYIYQGDGTAARKAAGVPLTGALTIANGAAGLTDAGFHLFGFVSETDSGFDAAPGAITGFTTSANFSVSFSDVPVSSDAHVVRRLLVATKVITGYTGNTTGYTFYFVPNAVIEDNTTTTLSDISFFDADLLEDASHLLDNLSEIPAVATLSFYHNRLVAAPTFTDISLAYVSEPGEPEAFNQVDGLIIVPLDGNPITNAQELRDVLYVFKRSKTVAYVDNGDVPSSWPLTFIDNALGSSLHGIATVLDSGSASVDQLIIANYKGINIFSGQFLNPELSWKIQGFWVAQNRDEYRLIQILNNPVTQSFYIILPDQRLLVGNYANGMIPIGGKDGKGIRWSIWSFIRNVNTVAIVNTDQLVFGIDVL